MRSSNPAPFGHSRPRDAPALRVRTHVRYTLSRAPQTQVQFIGEEGVDEGGVQKEFFQLLVGGYSVTGRTPFAHARVHKPSAAPGHVWDAFVRGGAAALLLLSYPHTLRTCALSF